MARSSSVAAALGSQSGRVASGTKRPGRSARTRAKASLVILASVAATAGASAWGPGAGGGERDHLRVHAELVEHRLPVGDVAVAAHHDVVVARVVDDRVARAVGGERERAAGRAQGVQVLRRVVMVVDVDDRHSGLL